MKRQSELQEAFEIAAALPKLQEEQLQRLIPLLKRRPIADLCELAEAFERYPQDSIREGVMKVRGEKVRVAEWYIDAEHRCQHKQYAEGNVRRAKIGQIGDPTWIEGWIA